MTKTLAVEGMGCMRCEARVKEALEAIEGVASAKADKDAKEAIVVLDKEVADDVLLAAVNAIDGFTATGMK